MNDVKLKYYDMVQSYFDEVMTPWLDKAGHGDHYYDENFSNWKSMGAKGTRLRLDWELSEEAAQANAGVLLAKQAAYDIADLIENGNRQEADWLFSAMDGAKARGKEPVSILVPEMTLYVEEKPKKKSIEYTLYLIVMVEWEE